MNPNDSAQYAYRLRVTGSTMEPRIKHGEFIDIEPGQEYRQGDEVVVCTRGGQTMLGLFTHWHDGQVRLDCVNPGYGPIFIPEREVECVHAVTAIARRSHRQGRTTRRPMTVPISAPRYKVMYLVNGRERESAWLYKWEHAQRGLEMMRAKYGKKNAIIYVD